MTDTLIRNKGMEVLADNLGLVEAGRFVMLVQKESFDYTKWQEGMFPGMTVEDIAAKAAEHRRGPAINGL